MPSSASAAHRRLWRGLITSDEEIASPSSRPVIERVAREARCVFNAEPGRPTGNVVTGRKGGVFMSLEIEGRAAHSGGNFEHGISAIGELAQKIVKLHAITDLKRGTTVNVGIVKGGQSVNTTAPSAEGQIDLRYMRPSDRTAAMAAIDEIVATSYVNGTRAKLRILGEFLPLNATPASERLFCGIPGSRRRCGLEHQGRFFRRMRRLRASPPRSGCPTICATGPVGANAHTPEEYLDVTSIVPRAQALALAILRLEPASKLHRHNCGTCARSRLSAAGNGFASNNGRLISCAAPASMHPRQQ